jgi:hypothetical protein
MQMIRHATTLLRVRRVALVAAAIAFTASLYAQDQQSQVIIDPVLKCSGKDGDPDAIGIAGGSLIRVGDQWRFCYFSGTRAR